MRIGLRQGHDNACPINPYACHDTPRLAKYAVVELFRISVSCLVAASISLLLGVTASPGLHDRLFLTASPKNVANQLRHPATPVPQIGSRGIATSAPEWRS